LSTDVSEVRGFIAPMEAARTSETSVGNYFTRQYIPEDKSERVYLNLFELKRARRLLNILKGGES
jgi:hypothetical protein